MHKMQKDNNANKSPEGKSVEEVSSLEEEREAPRDPRCLSINFAFSVQIGYTKIKEN